MSLAPDNKIYISTGNGTRYLHVINNPDSVGLACDLQQHSITLPSICANSIPYHPNYFLGPDVGSSCDTLTAISETIPINGEQIAVYPNPAQNYFIVKHSFEQNQSVQFVLFNSTGKEILSKNIFSVSQSIDISNLSNGIYFWQATITEKNISNGKLIILR
jgi:lysyl endopeptidase